jgi:hypothetical protein
MHCGKTMGYQCQVNDECSSKDYDNTCSLQPFGLNNFEGRITYTLIFGIFFSIILVFAFAMGLTICCCRQFTKESNK